MHAAAGLLDCRARLENLLIELGGFDFGNDLAGFDTVADIDGAFAEVAGGTGDDGGFGDGLYVARQHQAAIAGGTDRSGEVDNRHAADGVAGLGGEDLFAALAGEVADEETGNDKDDGEYGSHYQGEGGGAAAGRPGVKLALQGFDFGSKLVFGGIGVHEDGSGPSPAERLVARRMGASAVCAVIGCPRGG